MEATMNELREYKCHAPSRDWLYHSYSKNPRKTNEELRTCVRCGRIRPKLKIYYRAYGNPEGRKIQWRLTSRRQREKHYEEARKREIKKSKIRYALGLVKIDPIKYKCQYTLRNSVVNGDVKKPIICSVCGKSGRIHGHHSDYTKPLQVEWLCPKCHGLRHRKEPT